MNNNKLNEVKEDIEILKVLEVLVYEKIPQLIDKELEKKNISTNMNIEFELNVDILRRRYGM